MVIQGKGNRVASLDGTSVGGTNADRFVGIHPRHPMESGTKVAEQRCVERSTLSPQLSRIDSVPFTPHGGHADSRRTEIRHLGLYWAGDYRQVWLPS